MRQTVCQSWLGFSGVVANAEEIPNIWMVVAFYLISSFEKKLLVDCSW